MAIGSGLIDDLRDQWKSRIILLPSGTSSDTGTLQSLAAGRAIAIAAGVFRANNKVMRLGLPASHRPQVLHRSAFTLIEVIVVLGVITILLGVLVPGLSRARFMARKTQCLTGLQQIGVAICTYAMENRGMIPYGPKAPPPSATNFYPKTGNVTSLISLQSGAPVGLGLLLDTHLAKAPESLFCPGADEKWDTKESLAKVGKSQVEASYYYRHGSIASLSGPASISMVELDRMGNNRQGNRVRCLVMDTQFIAPPQMSVFNLYTRTHHKQRFVNALYTDGHVSTHDNVDDRYQVNVSLSVYNTLDRILSIFEELDKD